MNILLTGANGLLGQNAVYKLISAGHSVTAAGRGESRLPETDIPIDYIDVELTNRQRVLACINTIRPEVIIHAAAMAQPDACELNREDCYNSNVNATRYLLEAAELVQSKMVFISTDFIFSGDDGPYRETDTPAPVNYYGQTKWEAEQMVQLCKTNWAIVRTVLVYGNILTGTRSNVVTWVKDNLEKGNRIKVVSDQIRTPTYVEDLVQGIQLIIDKNARGIYHISGKEILTPYDMAVQVADYFGLDKSLMERVNASVFSQPARRPLKTGFIIDKAERELGYTPIGFMDGIRKMFPSV